jgi:hypothetical protein
MIIYECIEIHPNGYIGKIIVKVLIVLLILHFQIWRILVEVKLTFEEY